MARSFLVFTFALAAATEIWLSAGASPASAQPQPPAMPAAAPKPKQDPELQEALQLLLKDAKKPQAGPAAKTP